MADDSLLEVARAGLERSGEAQAEVSARRARRGIARFANNQIGQHVDLDEVHIAVRVARQGRVAAATTDLAEPDAVADAVRAAADLCEHLPAHEGFPGFSPEAASKLEGPGPAASVERADAPARAELLAAPLARAEGEGLLLSGTLETVREQQAVATTAGQAVEASTGHAATRVFAIGPDGESGFAGGMRRDLGDLDVAGLADHAVARCKQSRAPQRVEPGAWDVVLEPPAVAELMEWLSMIGFGAKEVEEGTSFLDGRAGRSVTGEPITFVADAPEAVRRGFAPSFDHEGTPSDRVTLVHRGVAKGPVYDRLHAARAGLASTGHAFVFDGEVVPAPRSLRLEGGSDRPEDLVSGLERGLLVSRFHYVNGMIDPPRAAMTGMTRDGTFLVERGEPVHAVQNLRFTDRILEALARTDGVGDRLEPVPTWWSGGGVMLAPALRIRGFRFTGVADKT